MVAAVGDHGEQPIRRLSFDHAGHQLDRRRVEPLRVLAHEQRRLLVGETAEQSIEHVEGAPAASFGPERHLVALPASLDLEQLGDHLDGVGGGPARATNETLHGGERDGVIGHLRQASCPPEDTR